MRLFVHGFFAFSLFLASLVFTGCDTTLSTTLPPAAVNKQPLVDVAHFQVGETVNVSFAGLPEEIEPHEELIKEDGTITLPLIGSIQAVGKTAGELQTEITDLYVPKYYVRLTVTVKPGDLVYYVRGEVNGHGSRQLYVGPTTVTKAIASAGDFSDFAGHTVSLIRANGQVIKVDVDKASEDPSLDLQVYPGDQIVVPRRIF